MVSDAQKKAKEKWERENIERIPIRFKKGTKERIQATGRSINGFVVEAVEIALTEHERRMKNDNCK